MRGREGGRERVRESKGGREDKRDGERESKRVVVVRGEKKVKEMILYDGEE